MIYSNCIYFNKRAINKESEYPEPEHHLLWLFLGKSNCSDSGIWVAIKKSDIKHFIPNGYCSTLIFDTDIAQTQNSCEYTKFYLGDDYQTRSKHCDLELKLPSNYVIPPKSSKCSKDNKYQKKSKHSKDYFDFNFDLDRINCPPPTPNPTNRVNNTVYVDSVYGNDRTGQVENLNRPFKTIQVAIDAIPNLDLEESPGWVVQVRPGIYRENIVIPTRVKVSGAGRNQTEIIGNVGSPTVSMVGIGLNNINSVKISGMNLPLVQVILSSDVLPLRVATVDNVEIEMDLPNRILGNPIINLSMNGANGVVRFIQSNISIQDTVYNGPGPRDVVVFNSSSIEHRLIDSTINLVGNPTTNYRFINSVNNRVVVEGGFSQFQIINQLPAYTSRLFRSETGFFRMSNHGMTLLVTDLTPQPNPQNVILFSSQVATMNVNNVNVNSDGDIQPLMVSAEAITPNSIVNLQCIQFPLSPIPRVIEENGGDVNYYGNPQDGSSISSGAPYTNIRLIAEDSVLEMDDHTIIVVPTIAEPIEIELIDPANASQTIIFKGRQFMVTNKSDQEVSLTRGVLEPFVVEPNFTLDLQATKTGWFVVGKYPN